MRATFWARSVAIAAVVAAAGTSAVRAQQAAPAPKREVLQRQDLRAPGHEAIMAVVELPAGAREGRHSHPAEALIYMLEGTVDFEQDGRPTATYRAGDSFFIEPGRVHEAVNRSGAPARALAVFVAEKGKPLSTPAR